ncbi:MAG: SHOCT domain-containing protein [Chloroflexota bacterium]
MTAEQQSSLDALTKLKDDGVLTDAEFEAKKADLLAKR